MQRSMWLLCRAPLLRWWMTCNLRNECFPFGISLTAPVSKICRFSWKIWFDVAQWFDATPNVCLLSAVSSIAFNWVFVALMALPCAFSTNWLTVNQFDAVFFLLRQPLLCCKTIVWYSCVMSQGAVNTTNSPSAWQFRNSFSCFFFWSARSVCFLPLIVLVPIRCDVHLLRR